MDQLNTLQFLNCIETIYFDEKIQENYLASLYQRSKKAQKANKITSQLSYLKTENTSEAENDSKSNLIILGSTDCEINLQLEVIKIHSKGKSHTLHSSMAQLRPHAKKIYDLNNKRLF